MNNAFFRACIRAAFAGTAALTLALPAQAILIDYGTDSANGYYWPERSAVGFQFVLRGDVRGLVPPQSTDKVINPWGWAHEYLDDGQVHDVNGTTIIYYAADDVTRITLSGTALPAVVPGTYLYSYPHGYGHRTYHTGINMGNPHHPSGEASPVELVSTRWIYEDASAQELDAVTLSWEGTLSRKTKTTAYLTTYIRTSDPKTRVPRSGVWSDTLYDPTKHELFTITNHSDRPLRIDTIGYIPNMPVPKDPECERNPGCKANQDELGSLNWDRFPPPGDAGSQFTRVKPPKKAIPPGGRYSFKVR